MSSQNMKKNDRKQIVKNIIWNGISLFLSAIISFTLTPYVTDNIGIEANGFITLADTCVSYINIIAVALNAFSARYISLAYHNGDYKEANEYYSSVVIADVILSILLFIPCSAMIWKLQYLLTISDGLISDVKILFFLILINWVISVIGTAFTVVAFIKNRASVTARNKGISSVIYAVSLCGLIYFAKIRVYYMAIGNLIAAIFNLCMNYYYARCYASEFKIGFSKFSYAKVKKLIASGIWNSIGNIGNLLNSGLDLLICNKLLSELIMGQVSVANQLSKVMEMFTKIFVNAFQPKQLELYAKGNIDELVGHLKVSMKVVGIVGNVFIFCFLTLGKPFYNLWLPGQDTQTLYNLTVIVLVGDILVTTVRPLFYVYTLTDKFKTLCATTIYSGILNVATMFLLIQYTGLAGYAIVGTTTVINLIMRLWVDPYFTARYLNLRKSTFFSVIFRHMGVFLIIAVLAYFIMQVVVMNTWMDFLKYGFSFGILSLILISVLELTDGDRKIICDFLKSKIKKKCNR